VLPLALLSAFLEARIASAASSNPGSSTKSRSRLERNGVLWTVCCDDFA
jgi:hypothetical protein